MIVAHRLAIVSVISTLVLIAVGVVVRATGSGLGCPDWPTCHGGLLPPGEKHPVIEMSHRVVASGVGFLVIGLAFSCWRSFRHVPRIWILAAAVVPMVGLQGLLGAITVVRELPPAIVATHLLTAFLILSALIVLLIDINMEVRSSEDRSRGRDRWPAKAALLVLVLLAAVVWVGGYMTESGASAACSSWPGCGEGSFFGNDRQELTHMLHRYGVAALAVAVVGLAAAMRRSSGAAQLRPVLAGALISLFGLQVLVGALNVQFEFPDALAVSHTVIASLIWGVLTAVAALGLISSRSRGGTAS